MSPGERVGFATRLIGPACIAAVYLPAATSDANSGGGYACLDVDSDDNLAPGGRCND